jgi:hypothetical protein
VAPKDFVSGGQRFLFRSKYDSSYATFTPTLAYLWYLVQSNGLYVVEARGAILSIPGLRATSRNILWSTTKVNEAYARPTHVR